MERRTMKAMIWLAMAAGMLAGCGDAIKQPLAAYNSPAAQAERKADEARWHQQALAYNACINDQSAKLAKKMREPADQVALVVLDQCAGVERGVLDVSSPIGRRHWLDEATVQIIKARNNPNDAKKPAPTT